jgi:diguanylate cyclase (GGDEF)-like protein/putative nucleotidyltransferase with HDIG domain
MPALAFWLAAAAAACGLLYVGVQVYRLVRARLEAAQRRAQQMSDLHLATIEALARAIDAKDGTPENAIRRVQTYATAVAADLGMTPDEIQAVSTAALLHDIGKLAVPDHILARPGPLSPEEFSKVRSHPQVGADIIAGVPFPYPVAPLIQSHHERWDGRGYPAGLKGEEIPLGARILFLVDYFAALTSLRPYHAPMSIEAAAALIEQEAGRALDPHVVRSFLHVLPRVRDEAEAAARPAVENGAPEPSPEPDTRDRPGPSVFDDIALAHGELRALYQIARAMGTSLGLSDTMTLISSRLSSLVPFSACALMLHDDASGTFVCRFATGTDSELLGRLVLANGQGLTGWVARHGQPLVNGRPAADLEAAGIAQPTVLQSALVCPLLFGDRVIGALAVYHTSHAYYHDDHSRLLHRVCEQAAAVVHNAMVFERTHEASLTDPLTALPNTRFMEAYIQRELARAEREQTGLALIVIDVNDFKEINDGHGHGAGDRALRGVAQTLRENVRPYDVCVRYAGDEFVVVLADCTREEAECKRLELEDAVAGLVFEPQPGVIAPLSISAGAAVYPRDGRSYDALLAAADRRMYGNKLGHKRETRGPLLLPPGSESRPDR